MDVFGVACFLQATAALATSPDGHWTLSPALHLRAANEHPYTLKHDGVVVAKADFGPFVQSVAVGDDGRSVVRRSHEFPGGGEYIFAALDLGLRQTGKHTVPYADGSEGYVSVSVISTWIDARRQRAIIRLYTQGSETWWTLRLPDLKPLFDWQPNRLAYGRVDSVEPGPRFDRFALLMRASKRDDLRLVAVDADFQPYSTIELGEDAQRSDGYEFETPRGITYDVARGVVSVRFNERTDVLDYAFDETGYRLIGRRPDPAPRPRRNAFDDFPPRRLQPWRTIWLDDPSNRGPFARVGSVYRFGDRFACIDPEHTHTLVLADRAGRIVSRVSIPAADERKVFSSDSARAIVFTDSFECGVVDSRSRSYRRIDRFSSRADFDQLSDGSILIADKQGDQFERVSADGSILWTTSYGGPATERLLNGDQIERKSNEPLRLHTATARFDREAGDWSWTRFGSAIESRVRTLMNRRKFPAARAAYEASSDGRIWKTNGHGWAIVDAKGAVVDMVVPFGMRDVLESETVVVDRRGGFVGLDPSHRRLVAFDSNGRKRWTSASFTAPGDPEVKPLANGAYVVCARFDNRALRVSADGRTVREIKLSNEAGSPLTGPLGPDEFWHGDHVFKVSGAVVTDASAWVRGRSRDFVDVVTGPLGETLVFSDYTGIIVAAQWFRVFDARGRMVADLGDGLFPRRGHGVAFDGEWIYRRFGATWYAVDLRGRPRFSIPIGYDHHLRAIPGGFVVISEDGRIDFYRRPK